MTRSHKKDISQIMPLSDIYAIISGMNPYVYNERKDEEIKVHSVYGEGVDETPSMFINNRKGRFYCHRSGFGGGAPEMVAGKKVEPHELGTIRRMIEQWARNGGCPNDHYEWTPDGEIVPPKSTEHLILKGIPKAWNYFRIAMRYGYKRNPQIMLAIKRYMSPAISPDNPEEVMPPIYDYVASQLGWCDLSNALVIPYGLNRVEMMELVFFVDGNKNIGAYPFSTHRQHLAFQKLHTVNGDHSFFSGTDDRPKVDLKPWPAGIGTETPPAIDDIYGTGAKGHEIVICEGVKDAIMARFHGFYAVAHHGGTNQLRKIYNVHNLFLDDDGNERVGYAYICMDSDPMGMEGARGCRGAFRQRKNIPYIVDVGHQATRGDGYDLHDFFTEGFTEEMLKMYFRQARIVNDHWGIR